MSFEAPNPELKDYLEDQIKFSKRKFQIASMDELAKQVSNSKIIYLGDFHTFDQNIRNVLRIVKLLISGNKKCILGLEMVSHEHQLFIDAYLEHHITELEFLELINYHDSWRFPWTHYKEIFELAKGHQIKIIGLNTSGSLKERDKFAAELLEKTHQDFPKMNLLVLYGELHISKDKIPALMQKKLPEANYTIIHQNLDEVYWKLIKQEIEEGIVSFTPNEYCIVSAPPWVKYESMIYWYENLIDDPDFDIHEYIIENGAKIFIDDTKENFYHIGQQLINHLNLDIDPDGLEDFNLYDHTNLDFVEEKLESILKPSLLKFYRYLISTNQSFRLPKGHTFYCSSYSMNRISYLAGIHIFHHFVFDGHDEKTLEIINSRSNVNKFILFCYEAMYGHFFSKVINPHRKCDMYLDLEEIAEEDSNEFFAMKILDSSDIATALTQKKLNTIYEISLFVGHILGEYLYLAVNNKDNKIELKTILEISSVTKKNFHKLKDYLLNNKVYKKHVKRYF